MCTKLVYYAKYEIKSCVTTFYKLLCIPLDLTARITKKDGERDRTPVRSPCPSILNYDGTDSGPGEGETRLLLALRVPAIFSAAGTVRNGQVRPACRVVALRTRVGRPARPDFLPAGRVRLLNCGVPERPAAPKKLSFSETFSIHNLFVSI